MQSITQRNYRAILKSLVIAACASLIACAGGKQPGTTTKGAQASAPGGLVYSQNPVVHSRTFAITPNAPSTEKQINVIYTVNPTRFA